MEGILSFELVGLGGLGVTCSPRDRRFAGSNSAVVDRFFQDVKKRINAGNSVDSALDRNYWRAFVNAALNLRVS